MLPTQPPRKPVLDRPCEIACSRIFQQECLNTGQRTEVLRQRNHHQPAENPQGYQCCQKLWCRQPALSNPELRKRRHLLRNPAGKVRPIDPGKSLRELSREVGTVIAIHIFIPLEAARQSKIKYSRIRGSFLKAGITKRSNGTMPLEREFDFPCRFLRERFGAIARWQRKLFE